ncbi:aspartate/glutamate racemase family protein [Streptomyces canus]|uniref:aspartate/glutamate racemase family protein n=1 Tax=Streptomyces canus TaxID=58343 RepID=UPI000363BCB4|nr:aspartate/glutamate racemase family protein [Streptomyces canus]
MSSTPKIALISAVPAAIPAARAALRDTLPDAVVWNILDDRLLVDAVSHGGLDSDLRHRMQRLIGHALAEDVDAVLLTCSVYAPVAQGTDAGVPVMAPDEAAFADIAAAGYASVLVLASVDTACDDSVERLQTALHDAGADSRVVGLSVPAALAAATAGDQDALVAAFADACVNLPDDVEAIFLAQYSLASAGDALQEAVGIPVVSGPKSAAAALLRLMSERNGR